MSSFRDGKVGSTPSRIHGETIEMTNSAHPSLTSVLPKLRKRIQKIQNRNENIGEQNTKAALIDPLLAALGWDVEDIDEVSREYRLDLRRFRGLFQTENSARKGEQCHERTRPTHRSFAEKLSGW
jgi:hypothetical protein